ncbi:hypothetical protein E4U03_12315 [Rothia nasimurium]|uniref:Uncharacterized protein n=1 Tax=Rothia nasimurium TaxID=85336 RepID=A0A4Y9F1D1_9MICC|nr:hypothetical protein [Rothia nasimurium]MBF0809380.1 hypothetical protein [Rothia nasimurium]TFU19584.1 hypothetical protein E4U03_12315 [Rothia nasimurium]
MFHISTSEIFFVAIWLALIIYSMVFLMKNRNFISKMHRCILGLAILIVPYLGAIVAITFTASEKKKNISSGEIS